MIISKIFKNQNVTFNLWWAYRNFRRQVPEPFGDIIYKINELELGNVSLGFEPFSGVEYIKN